MGEALSRPAKQIERGLEVTVVMARNDIFPWQTGPRFRATYRFGPSGPGDVFTFQVGDREVSINGNAADFIGIYAEEERYSDGVPF